MGRILPRPSRWIALSTLLLVLGFSSQPLSIARSQPLAAGRPFGVNTLVSVDDAGVPGNSGACCVSVSSSGRFVAFASSATDLVPGGTNGQWQVFVRDRQQGETTLVSVNWLGTQGNDTSIHPAISLFGRYVAFESSATNLEAAGLDAKSQIYVRDRQTDHTDVVSLNVALEIADDHCYSPSISANGRYVAFSSAATNLVEGGTDGASHIYVHDLDTYETTLVSTNGSGDPANGDSFNPVISSSGDAVAFSSDASDLVDGGTDGQRHVFLSAWQGGEIYLISVNSSGEQGNGDSDRPSMSATGSQVAFESTATNLVAGGTASGVRHIYVRDRDASQTTLVSVDSAGVPGNDDSYEPSVSGTGRDVAFQSAATNLVAPATDQWHIYVHHRDTGATALVSASFAGEEGNDESYRPSIAAMGNVVAFISEATNLVATDCGGYDQAFVSAPPEAVYLPIVRR